MYPFFGAGSVLIGNNLGRVSASGEPGDCGGRGIRPLIGMVGVDGALDSGVSGEGTVQLGFSVMGLLDEVV